MDVKSFAVVIVLICFYPTQTQGCFPKCDIRYEYSDELHRLWNYNTCQDVYNLACICKNPIDILFIEVPPYIYTDSATNKVVGLFPGIIDQAFQACCYGCTNIRYLKPFKTVTEGLLRLSTATAMMPVVAHSAADTVVADTFIKLIPTKGVGYVTIEDKDMKELNKFFNSIGANWPLFCIALLLAINAGVIIWILDSWKNREEFPAPFYRGVYEGLWWAFITMTTVGYGDKAPKTLLSKMFGIVWVTVGISITGIFTASVMTGMTNALKEGALDLNEKRVGVLNNSRYEYSIAVRDGANATNYGTYESLKTALKKNEIDGILLDVLVLRHYWDDLKADIKDIRVRQNAVKNSQTTYGFLFAYEVQNATNKNWSTFLSAFFNDNHDNTEILIYNAMKKLPKKLPVLPTDSDEESKMFNSPTLMQPMFKYLGTATLVCVVFGFLFERMTIWYKRRFSTRVGAQLGKWKTKVGCKIDALQRKCIDTQAANAPVANIPANIPMEKFKEFLKKTMEEVEVEVTNRMIEKFYKKVPRNNGKDLELKEFSYGS